VDTSVPGHRIREARGDPLCGMTQRELAEAAGLSLSAIKKIEQGTLGQLRLETAHRLAAALGVTTLAIADPAPQPPRELPDESDWVATRDALLSPAPTVGVEPVTERGTTDALLSAVKLYHDNEYERLARMLPLLLRDVHDASPLLWSRTMQLAGSVMIQTRNLDSARVALTRSRCVRQARGTPRA
jgi:transcriptional regulator with XRE-family HTH domain